MPASIFRLFLLLLIFLAPSPVWGRFDPRLEWQSFATEHFVVLYHQGGEELAGRAAAIAEEVHGELSRDLRWTPRERTRLVLADVSDAPNAMATPFPYNRIILYLAPPLEQPFSLTDREEWLRVAIVHEYTHILHLDAVHDVPALLRTLFGRLYFPNAWQPAWLVEGLATYQETRLSRGGRGRSSYRNMLLRAAVREGEFPALADAGVFPDFWPQGEVPYLFGEAFYRHLIDRYGAEFPGAFAEAYAGRTFPLLIDGTMRRLTGTTFANEWRLWRQQLPAAGTAGDEDHAALERLTSSGFSKGAPSLAPDGRRLVFAAASSDHVPSLLLREADGTLRTLGRRLAVPAGEGVVWHPDGNALIYAALSRDPRDNLFSDLYRFDLTTAKATRLTRGLRAGAPDRHPASGELLFTAAGIGDNRLMISDADGRNPRPLTPAGHYARPRWSPDGTRIAVVAKEAGRFRLRLLDRDGHLIADIPTGGGIVSAPAWSPDGRLLYFVSDRDGTSQLYAWRAVDRTLWQVSDDGHGLFAPEPSRDGAALFVLAYSAAGFDLARLPLHPERWRQLAVEEEAPSTLPPAATPPPSAAPYRPWADLRPRYWLPWFGSDEDGGTLGLLTSGEDAVARHAWSANLQYGRSSRRPAASLLYRYDGWLPTLEVTAGDTALPYGNFYPVSGCETYWERERAFSADLLFPGGTLWQRHTFIAGLRYRHFAPLLAAPAGLNLPPGGELAGGRLAWRYVSAVRPARAISPEDGRLLEFAVQHSSPLLATSERSTASLDWREYLTFADHRVVATRLFAAAASGDLLPQRAFQLGGDNPGEIVAAADTQYLPLRGYPVNSQRGERALLAGVEYRFPVGEVGAGSDNGALYMRRVHGALFAEAGAASDRDLPSADELRRAVGGELRFDLDAAYSLPLTLRVVVAKGLDQDGEAQGYLSAWLRF